MYSSRNDPRLRRTLDHISQNFESANESAQANLYTFSHNYLNPCLDSLTAGVQTCIAPCLGSREDRLRRNRSRSRGRAELSFDFYDDWEEDETDGLLGWGNDELDRLLHARGSGQPGRQRAMSYGARRGDPKYPAGRRKSAVQPHDGGPDPTIIPNTSYFGFLGRLPWKIGGKGLRYKPSAADLQEHPGQLRRSEVEEQPLIEESDEDADYVGEASKHKRQRSDTHGSAQTSDSLSSRGDIFPSEDELDDAVPLDDEFAMALERRNTGFGADDNSSGKTRRGKRPRGSRMSTRTTSSRSTQESIRRSMAKSPGTPSDKLTEAGIHDIPTMSDLRQEEERIRKEEETDIEMKRDAARVLASKRGLHSERPISPSSETKSEDSAYAPMSPRTRTVPLCSSPEPTSPTGLVPFPSFDSRPASPLTKVDNDSSGKPVPNDSRRNQEMEESGFVPACLPHFQPRPPPG
ncbi:hypothetical protein K490DRAFT_69009 [Saccharata proteae CBS 121410]|uniref:Uncharacterized protein n=1 Tax=Saccharata proteae CBS 121410 TaxID=1314787 RepID=A0A9P4LTV5_9PEZI|nr:hypothetical protein K490DRAFT_69009 [Saccharata proteae CBS 121410]